jgi:4'-phosphopantetheinyl transferase
MNLTHPWPAAPGTRNCDSAGAGLDPGPPGPDEIHLWRADLDEFPGDEEIWLRLVSSAEQARARRFIFEEHRRRYLAAKAWTRRVLAAYLKLSPRDLPLTAGAHGKPQIAAEANHADLRFSLSHCGRFALLAVATGCEVGVDLQAPLPEDSWPAVAERFFTREERECVRCLPAAAQASACTEIWTRKEAAGKALGLGLSPQVLALSVGPAAWGAIHCGDDLHVWSLPPQARQAVAVAALSQPDAPRIPLRSYI